MIIKETKSFVWELDYDNSKKKISSSSSQGSITLPENCPCIRLYLKNKFLGISLNKFIIGIKFIHREHEYKFPFGGVTPRQVPTTMIFQRPGGAGREHNDANSIHFRKKNEDQYYVDYNRNLNTLNDLTWMLPYQLFWDNDPSYIKSFGIQLDIDILQTLNEELGLDLFYKYHPHHIKGTVPFEHEAYHECGEQEEHFMNMMISDRRENKLNEILK